MKVLLVQKMAGISGSERYFLSVLPALKKRGVDARFLVVQHPANAQKNDGFISELKAAGVGVYVIDSRLSISPWLVWRLARIIKQQGIDILQTNLIHADVWGGCVKRFLLPKLRLVSVKHGYSDTYQTAHGLDPAYLKPDLMARLTRWAAGHSNRVVSISSALVRFFVDGGLVSSDRSVAVPYGFDFSEVVLKTPADAVRFGKPQIVVPGRVVPVKQHHLLIGILPELVREFPSLSIVMVGAGPLLDELKADCARKGLSEHVRWEGFRTNMHDYLRDSDLAVIPSAAEGFGLVVLEAWHHAKPVLAFDVPAINEIVESGTDGVLVTPFDTRQLLERIKALLADPARMQAMGNAGKRKQVETYGLDAMCEATIKVYDEVLAGDAAPGEPRA